MKDFSLFNMKFKKPHFNAIIIIGCCLVTMFLIASCSGTSWLINERLLRYQGIWRNCQELSFGRGSICASFGAKDSKEHAVRAFLVLAILLSIIGFGLSLFSTFVKTIKQNVVIIFMAIVAVFMIISLSIYTNEKHSILKRRDDYSFGWSYVIGWIGTITAFLLVIFGVIGTRVLLGDRDLSESHMEQTDELVFERF